MKTQIIKDANGRPTGVFIPIEQWKHIKSMYPNIENTDDELPQWQKDLLDERIADLDNPDRIEPIEEFYKALDAEI